MHSIKSGNAQFNVVPDILVIVKNFYMATPSPDKSNKATKIKEITPAGESADKWWQNNKYITWLGYCLLLVPVVIYFSLVNKYAVNLPYLDDYNAILEFLSKFKTADFTDKIALLFSQHSDHRIFHARIIYVLYYYIFGKINFIHLIFIGNLQLVVIYFLFIHFIKKVVPKYWSIVSLFAGICLFDLSSYENADYAMCGITNYGVLMLFMVSLYYYNKTGHKYLILAGLFEAICIFSSGSGLICALCLVVFTLLSREKLKSITSASIFITGIPLYYFHYQKMTEMGNITDAFTSTRDVSFFFHMLGNHFSFEYGVFIGVCELVFLLVLLPTNLKSIRKFKFKPETLPLISILCLLIGTSLSIAVFRSNDERLGEIASYASRYLIYTHMLAAVLFLLLWIKIDGKNKSLYVTTLAAGSLILFAYANNSEFGKNMLVKAQRRLEFYPYYYKDRTRQDMDEAMEIATEACRQGIYCIDEERRNIHIDDIDSMAIQINTSEPRSAVVDLPASPNKYLLTVFNADGRKLVEKTSDGQEYDIHVVFKISPGNYVLKVQNNNRNWQKAFTVK